MRILLFAALWPEVRGLVQRMEMRAVQNQLPYRQYQDDREEILLTVTGTGPVAVAAAVGSVLTVYRPSQVVLIGSAAGQVPSETVNVQRIGSETCRNGKETGDMPRRSAGLYRINKLIDADAERTFYPDLIYPHTFALPEASLYSRARIWGRKEVRLLAASAGICIRDKSMDVIRDSAQSLERAGSFEKRLERKACVPLFDMEGAAFFQAANHFLGPQQIHILKLVSDRGQAEKEKMSAQSLEVLMQEGIPQVQTYLRALLEDIRTEEETADRLAGVLPGQEELEKRAGDLCCSASMEHQLRQVLIYAGLAGKDWRGCLHRMEAEERVPVSNRRQGKLLLRELTKWVMRDE